MPSPFPGMDPFLEDPALWPDFHATFINYCRKAIAERLPDNYVARIGERLRLVARPPERSRQVLGDITVARQGSVRPSATAAPAGTVTLEPVTGVLPHAEVVPETRIEIFYHPRHILVTVLELLSPSNKTGADRIDYQAKRLALLRQPIHLVELDLLLGGERLDMVTPLPPGDYYAFVSRSEQRPHCDIFAWPLLQRLPTIPVPLQSPDPDVMLDLAAVFATTYEQGYYARSIDYTAPPVPLPEAATRHLSK